MSVLVRVYKPSNLIINYLKTNMRIQNNRPMRCGLYKRMSAAVKMLLFTQAVPFLLLSETHVVQGGGKDCDNFIGKDKKVGKVNAPFFGVNDKSVKCTNLCGFAMNKDLSLK